MALKVVTVVTRLIFIGFSCHHPFGEVVTDRRW